MAVRERLRGLVDVQVVALVGRPIGGAGREVRALLTRPSTPAWTSSAWAPAYLEDDPVAATEALLRRGRRAGPLVDIHTDETLDPSVLTVRDLAGACRHGPRPPGDGEPLREPRRAAAGRAGRVAEALAAAGMSVVALPQTNLFLQARGVATAPPRGLTAIGPLRAAGVTVAGGADNLQDPFNLVGRADPLETAALLVMAGHVEPATAYEMVSNEARRAMGLEPVALCRGPRPNSWRWPPPASGRPWPRRPAGPDGRPPGPGRCGHRGSHDGGGSD